MIAIEATEDIEEQAWLHAAAVNPAFDNLEAPEEAIYSLEDGKPINVED